MFEENNKDERPRFDAKTGMPIYYDDENNTSEASADASQYRYTNSDMPESTFSAGAEPVGDSGMDDSTSFYTNERADEGNTYYDTATVTNQVDKKAAKKAAKAAKKAAKCAAGSSGANSSGGRKILKMIAASLMCGVIAGGSMYGVYYSGVYFFPTSASTKKVEIATVSTAGTNATISDLTSQSSSDTSSTATMNVSSVAKAAMPAVVAISGKTTTTASYNPFNSGVQEASTSGTGIIIGKSDTELLIVTNAHVVENVSDLKVTFNDEESVNATVKGSKTDKDIAVVAVKISDIKDTTISSIAIAELGDSDQIQVGEQVIAIGNALGEGQSVTVGWISALNRSITVENTQYTNLIMTDAAINPGNSGGALLNAKGQVIGINSAKYASEEVEGMGYAIPISSVKDIIGNLSTKTTRNKVDSSKASALGIYGADVTSSMSSTYGFPQGVYISQLISDSAAEKAGLVKSDIIVSFDDDDISSMDGLKSTMEYYASGETVKIGYYHMENGSYALKEVQVTLGSASSSKSSK